MIGDDLYPLPEPEVKDLIGQTIVRAEHVNPDTANEELTLTMDNGLTLRVSTSEWLNVELKRPQAV